MTGTPLRIVIDTNTLVSVLLVGGSVPARAFDVAATTGVLLLSEATLAELRGVLGRAKFDRYSTRGVRDAFVRTYERDAERISVLSEVRVCRDPDDDKFLALALDGRADVLISGDFDLLALHPFRGIDILFPAQFLERCSR